MVQALLGRHCFPLGMELFPSNGLGQWPLIEESIASADFCVFVVAGRYGSICQETQTSWTQREFRAAIAAETPIIAILHSDPDALPARVCEETEDGRRRLEEFREEIKEATNVCHYQESAELINGLHVSIDSLKNSGRIKGWLRAGAKPILLQEDDYDRTYDEIRTSWSFRRSESDPATWDGSNSSFRKFTVNDSNGLSSIAWDISRDSDLQLPFGPGVGPHLTLVEWTRESVGIAELQPPRRSNGATFVQDVKFTPGLQKDETAVVKLACEVPRYKHAFAEDMNHATRQSLGGPRGYDWTTRLISYPTKVFVQEAFLPLDLKAEPIGPMVGRKGEVNSALSNELKNNGSYEHEVVERNGVAGHQMRLTVENPRLRHTYRLAWSLPSRA